MSIKWKDQMELPMGDVGGNGKQLAIANTVLARNDASVNEHSFSMAMDRIHSVCVCWSLL